MTSDAVFHAVRAYDAVNTEAMQHEVADLPPDTLDSCSAAAIAKPTCCRRCVAAVRAFAPGWARVQAICDFVNNHIAFGYDTPDPTCTALQAYQKRTGVCRDFAHLAIAFAPRAEHPGALLQRLHQRRRTAAAL